MTGQPLDIESTANPRARAWASLSKRSVRDETGTFLIEGARETERALGSLTVREVIWCPEYGAAPESGEIQAITSVSTRVFDKISRRQNPDGVAAVGVTPDMSLATFVPSDPALVLVGDAMEKPGNIGAMLRTCDAFGAGFIGSSLGTDLVNPNVIRTAQGSVFATPLASAGRAGAIEWAIEHTRIVVAHPEGATSLWDQDLTGPTTIVIGSEHAGVDPQWLEVGTPVLIPMTGVADSLNASVTAGVFLSEAARQRSG
jgi:TrmH family RNA methyltransferase